MNVLDLFCGAVGGWSAGLRRAGYRTVAACEVDPWRRAVFAEQHPGAIMYPDVRELTADRLRADLGYLPDVVVGSPPCQEISAANSKGTGITDDHLFWDWARLVFEIRPLWCAAENSHRARSEGIDGILDALEQARYAPWAHVVGADHAGANHRRRRLWLVAADAERLELWQQPGRSGGTNRRGAAVAGELDSNADGEHGAPGRALRRSAGQGGRDPGGHDARHAALIPGLRLGGVCGGAPTEPAQVYLSDGADADGRFTSRARRHADGRLAMGAGADGGNAPDPDSERHSFGPSERGDDGPELPAALRGIGESWPDWNGGLAGLAAACAAAGFGALDDGSADELPAGLRNRAIAALGDAVVDKIPEIIGLALMQGERPCH